MQQEKLQYLLERYGTNEATAEELAALTNYLEASGTSDTFEQAGYAMMQAYADQQAPADADAYRALLAKIIAVDKPAPASPVRSLYTRYRWIAAAAVVLVLATAMAMWLGRRKPAVQEVATTAATHDIEPGKDGAILTLADGSRIVLDSMGNGTIAQQNGANIVVKNGGVLYDATSPASGDIVYNTMSTPKGRQFQLTLPDGTKVWLNSASSIRFPTRFSEQDRRVDITGEAYFEVAKNADMPFRVNVNNKAVIEVLGTHFNVNAYDNEPAIHTTLLEGRVKVAGAAGAPQTTAVLTPGQQAQLTAQQMVVNNHVDMQKVMAWKNGLFNFDGSSLEEVMKQLERWYDIQVVYEQGVPGIRFFGKMSKDMTLAQVLDALKTFDVHFTIEGKKLIIQP